MGNQRRSRPSPPPPFKNVVNHLKWAKKWNAYLWSMPRSTLGGGGGGGGLISYYCVSGNRFLSTYIWLSLGPKNELPQGYNVSTFFSLKWHPEDAKKNIFDVYGIFSRFRCILSCIYWTMKSSGVQFTPSVNTRKIHFLLLKWCNMGTIIKITPLLHEFIHWIWRRRELQRFTKVLR